MEAIEKLSVERDAIAALGVEALYLFGSTAADRASEDSDLDLFIDYDPASKFSLLDLVAVKQHLEHRLGAVIDVTTRDALHPLIRPEIERTAVKVF